jgi:hypothetical protein
MNTITSRNGVELIVRPVRKCASCGGQRPGELVDTTDVVADLHRWGFLLAPHAPLPGFRCAVCGETTLGGAA